MKYSLKQQIYRLLIPIFILLALVIVVFSFMLNSINSRYEQAMESAVIAADFNKEFKSTLDQAMYDHVIQPRTEHSKDDLPLEELDQAEEVLHRLEKVTKLPDNQWRIQSMLYMCGNLRMYMNEIAETESYDTRMQLLEKNIRGETGLTTLIVQYMHDFVDDEVQEMARLSADINRECSLIIIVAVLVISAIYVVMMFYTMKVTNGITEPITNLTKKARRFGTKGFDKAIPIETNIEELRILDDTFNEMTDHINTLMNKQVENERSLSRAELELLQAQINPHFLYNTLDSIVVLAESNREDDVINMITSLSNFFRNSLSEGEDIHTIRAEFTQAASYLEIQQIRYSDILSYSINVSDDIQNCLIPKLVLQPLIENALYHGIKNRRGRGLITITGERNDKNILLVVRDNGVGMTPEQLEKLQYGTYQEKLGSYGLWNVHQRIKLYCGEGCGLTFESVYGEGTTVTVTLPYAGVEKTKDKE